MGLLFARLPSSFLPAEDQGFLFSMVQTPVGATQERTMKVIERVERHFLEDEKDTVDSLFTVQGFSFGGSGQNNGIAFVNLKDWSERKSPELASTRWRAGHGALSSSRTRSPSRSRRPAMPELGTSAGFAFYLKDNLGRPRGAHRGAQPVPRCAASQSPLLANVRPNGQDDTPQFRIDVDVAKAGALGLSTADINATRCTAWGGQYIDDFIDRGRVKRVFLQADAPFRMVPEDFHRWSVRNPAGRDGALLELRDLALGYGSPAARALQRRAGDGDHGRGGARA